MNLLTLETFLPHLAAYADKEQLNPGEALRLLLTITELLIDHNVDLPLLKFLSRFLTQASYDDIVEERNIEHECGYIVCNSAPTQRVRRLSSNSNGTTTDGGETKFQIYNRKPSIILPNTFLLQYCCKEHYQASMFYRNQLSTEAIFARKDIVALPPFPEVHGSWYENSITCLEEVLAKHKELQSQGKSLLDVIMMMSGLSMDDESEVARETSELIKLIEDFEIVEKDTQGPQTFAAHDNEFSIIDSADEEDDDKYVAGKVEYVTSNKSFGGYVV